MNRRYWFWPIAFALPLLGVCGCESNDDRLVRATQQADARQAAQNQALAKLAAEQQRVQTGIESERERLDHQRSALEDERREITAAATREPLVANALIGAALLVACSLPLLLAFFVLWGVRRSDSEDAAVGELLIQDLVSENPLLLPRPLVPAIEEQPGQQNSATDGTLTPDW
jgi:hypothetical protein